MSSILKLNLYYIIFMDFIHLIIEQDSPDYLRLQKNFFSCKIICVCVVFLNKYLKTRYLPNCLYCNIQQLLIGIL